MGILWALTSCKSNKNNPSLSTHNPQVRGSNPCGPTRRQTQFLEGEIGFFIYRVEWYRVVLSSMENTYILRTDFWGMSVQL